MGAELLHADGQTDSCDEANNRFFCNSDKATKNNALDFDSRTSWCEWKHLWTPMKYGLPICSDATALGSTQANCHRESLSTLQTCLLNTAQTAHLHRCLYSLFLQKVSPYGEWLNFPPHSTVYRFILSFYPEDGKSSHPPPPHPAHTSDRIPWNIYHSLSGTLPTRTPTCLAFYACKERERDFFANLVTKIYVRWNKEEVFKKSHFFVVSRLLFHFCLEVRCLCLCLFTHLYGITKVSYLLRIAVLSLWAVLQRDTSDVCLKCCECFVCNNWLIMNGQ